MPPLGGTFENVLVQSHSLILERHLEAVSPTNLVLWSLRGLSVLDARFNAEIREDRILLLGEDRVLASTPLAPLARQAPPERLGGAVAEALDDFYAAAWRESPQLRQAGTERLLASGFDELFNHLDPYSRYVPASEARNARMRRIGQSGLGLRISAQRGGLVIDTVTRDGPAAQAGIRVGDRLVAVDGRRLGPRDPGLAATLLEGPEGSAVTLAVTRAGRPRTVRLVRELVIPETVSAERGNDILHVRLTGFSAVTDRRLTQVLRDGFAERPPRGVVLDLRGNRGGLLSQAVAVADAFLADGEVMRTEGRHPEANRRYLAGGEDLAAGLPVVVLVDGRTASSAEIVAAALSERGRAVVVGSATMGKGLIQLVASLPNGAEMMVTWSRIVAISGWPIQGIGVLPALCTSLGPEVVAQGLAALRQGEAPMARTLTRLRAARAPVLASEITALRNACPPAEGREDDQQAARALIETPAAYATALGGP